ncbi:hypothetical protein [Arenicella xantha]|uniref:TadE-like protein n=1 Tax=Arenicella xantha TaxID=644221 RepID=A0A395JP84_9GAMM|nr:hypothetical protein [Arenicella xantha]RBP51384.1 hypothetical protein DFR28_102804 [Arenicella xantha]
MKMIAVASLPGKQSGAVWAEFVVVSSFVLISVFTLVPLVGKMIDTKQKVEQSSRYAGWERTVWFQRRPSYHPNRNLQKTNAQLQNEIHQRVFSEPDSVVHSRQHIDLNNIDYDPMQRFHNRNKSGRDRYDTLLVKKGEVSGKDSYVVLTQTDRAPPSRLANAGAGVINTLGSLGDFNVNKKGYYTGSVSVEIKEFDWFPEFNGVKPTFTAHTALLTDGWNAGGPSDVEARVTPFFPQDWINGPVTSSIQQFAGFFFTPLRPSSLEIGKVDSEPVPASRLTRYRP